jgi:hypothetical protein
MMMCKCGNPHDLLSSQVQYLPGKGKGKDYAAGGTGGRGFGPHLGSGRKAEGKSGQSGGKGQWVFQPAGSGSQSNYGNNGKGDGQSRDNSLGESSTQSQRPTNRNNRFSQTARSKRQMSQSLGGSDVESMDSELKARLASVHIGLKSMEGRKDPAAQELKLSLTAQSKQLQHVMTSRKPPEDQIVVLENFIEKKMAMIKAAEELVVSTNQKMESLRAEINQAEQQLQKAKLVQFQGQACAKGDANPLTPLLSMVGELDSELSSQFQEGLRQLIEMAQAKQQGRQTMEKEPELDAKVDDYGGISFSPSQQQQQQQQQSQQNVGHQTPQVGQEFLDLTLSQGLVNGRARILPSVSLPSSPQRPHRRKSASTSPTPNRSRSANRDALFSRRADPCASGGIQEHFFPPEDASK